MHHPCLLPVFALLNQSLGSQVWSCDVCKAAGAPGSLIRNNSADLHALRKRSVWHLSGDLPPFSFWHLVCAACQQDGAVGPNITRFLLFLQLQMRSCPGKKRQAGNWCFVFMTAKQRRKLTQMYWGLAEIFKVFFDSCLRHCGQKPHDQGILRWSCAFLLVGVFLPLNLSLQKLTG